MEGVQQKETRARRSILIPLRHWIARALPRAFAEIATTVYGIAGDWRGWRPVLARTSAHLAVVVVAVFALGLSTVDWPSQAAAKEVAPAAPALSAGDTFQVQASSDTQPAADSQRGAELAGVYLAGNIAVARLPQPHTIIPVRPREVVITYTVQAGDTIQAIAAAFRLEPTTLMLSLIHI